MKQRIIIGGIALVVIIAALIGVYYAGKRVADREAALAELRHSLSALQAENSSLKQQRIEIPKETAKNIEATRSSRAQIDSDAGRVADAEANIGIHIRPSPSGVQGSVPDAPSFVIQHQELPLLTSYITDFKTNLIELSGCKKELAVCDKQIANLTKQQENVGEQLKIESKKHGFWVKAKWAAIGIGIGAAAGFVAHR